MQEEQCYYFTEVRFDDGDAMSEDVWVNNSLVGAIWTDGDGLGWYARAISNIAGYWAKDSTRFGTRGAALDGLLHQAAFERT